jgi:hypothetical protein
MPATAETKRLGAFTSRGRQSRSQRSSVGGRSLARFSSAFGGFDGRAYVLRRDEQAGGWEIPEVAG